MTIRTSALPIPFANVPGCGYISFCFLTRYLAWAVHESEPLDLVGARVCRTIARTCFFDEVCAMRIRKGWRKREVWDERSDVMQSFQ